MDAEGQLTDGLGQADLLEGVADSGFVELLFRVRDVFRDGARQQQDFLRDIANEGVGFRRAFVVDFEGAGFWLDQVPDAGAAAGLVLVLAGMAAVVLSERPAAAPTAPA